MSTNMDDLQAMEDLVNNKPVQFSAARATIISNFLKYEKSRNEALTNPFIWFYEDLIKNKLQFEFPHALGKPVFDNANDDALVCLELAIEVRQIKAEMIFSWVSAALKTIDHIVVHYIQDYLKVSFIKYLDHGEENSRYRQLQGETDPIGTSATYLSSIYSSCRNPSEHRSKVNKKTGRTYLIKPNAHSIKQNGILWFERALLGILEGYKIGYPQHIIH